jgi:hypothetical protein
MLVYECFFVISLDGAYATFIELEAPDNFILISKFTMSISPILSPVTTSL